jgi:hypothetical protein
MSVQKNITRKILLCCALTLMLCAELSASASAQMSPQPWGFAQQNRASIAALMKQTENPTAATSAGSGDTLICGGGTGQASATANSTCIILSQASGQIQLGQDSNGSQSSASSDSTTQSQADSGGADSVLTTLSNPAQPAN